METENIQETIAIVVEVLTTYGLNMVGAIVVLIIGWIASKWVKAIVLRLMRRSENIDEMVTTLTASLARYVVLAVTIVTVLGQFGVETTSLVAVLGTAGLAIGLALQGTLSNVAAGFMLLLFRPFAIGNYVEAGGVAGTVKALNLFTTELSTPDNVHIIVPNSQIWGSAVKNFSYHDTRRVDWVFGVSYEDDIDKVTQTIEAVIGADERVHDDPALMIVVSELADSSVNFTVRAWCDAADYWDLKFDMTKAIKQRFDAEGISIPYPQRVIHQAAD